LSKGWPNQIKDFDRLSPNGMGVMQRVPEYPIVQ
jgi:hypothetical protein